ncbi:MAG: DUF5777 family beta-barrel protein [Cytophagaceae bacterium]
MLLALIMLTGMPFYGVTQELSDSLLPEEKKTEYIISTFDGTRVINGQSVENPHAGSLQLLFSHRFGSVSTGIHTLYGLDQSNVRIGFDYGISERLAVGIGRSSQKETYDSYLKLKLLTQSKGLRNMPVSVSLFASATAMTNQKNILDTVSDFSARLSYVYQVIIARKFNRKLSLQLSPTLVYRNQVQSVQDDYYVYATGLSGRYKLTKRLSLTAEYFYVFSKYTADHYFNSASLGIDIETGGHVFQLHLTNSQGMIEQFFIAKTSDDWLKKGIRLGFNISRNFTIVRNKNSKSW